MAAMQTSNVAATSSRAHISPLLILAVVITLCGSFHLRNEFCAPDWVGRGQKGQNRPYEEALDKQLQATANI
jgi:hypothetical protein